MADLRISQSAIETLDGGDPDLRVSQSVLEVLSGEAVPLRVSQSVIEVLHTQIDPTPYTGDNPAPDNIAGTVHFAHIKIGVESHYAAEALLRDTDADNFPGKKPATLLSISSSERVLSQDGYRAARFSIRISDTPDPVTGERAWRGVMRTRTLDSIFVEVFRCHAPNGIILGTPFRCMAGVVQPGGFPAGNGFIFDLECVDILGDRFANPLNQPDCPTYRLTPTNFPAIDPASEGVVAPRIFGRAFEAGVGACPMVLVAEAVNAQTIFGGGAMNLVMDWYLLSEGTVSAIYQGYYNLPTYGGTDAADRLVRYPIPPDAYTDNVITHPYASNWETVTGQSDQFVDYAGRRLTVVGIKNSHAYAPLVREKKVVVLFDVDGAMDDASLGVAYLSFEEIYVRLLLDYLFSPGNLSTLLTAIPEYNSLTGLYAVIDVETLYASKALGDAQSLIAGFVIGATGSPESMWALLSDLLRGGGLEIGQNRHGQLIFSRRDSTADPTWTLRVVPHIITSSYTYDGARRANHVEYRFGKRYVNPFAAVATPAEGEPLPAEPAVEWEWASGVLEVKNQTAIDALWNTSAAIVPPLEQENRVTRDATTALAVANQALAYGHGAAPAYHGTMRFEITGPWEILTDLDSNGKTRELGDVMYIDDDEAPAPTSPDTLLRGRITRIVLDPQNDLVTLAGEILEP